MGSGDDSSSDEETKKHSAPIGRRCCFWVKQFPPVKYILLFFKWLFTSTLEWKILKTAKKIFKVCNADNDSCCADWPYAKLGKMERMYLHRILKDQQRWGKSEYSKFIEAFQSQLVEMQKDDTDGGNAITEEEFKNAVLYAVQGFMERLVEKMSKEIKKEYEKDAEMADA